MRLALQDDKFDSAYILYVAVLMLMHDYNALCFHSHVKTQGIRITTKSYTKCVYFSGHVEDRFVSSLPRFTLRLIINTSLRVYRVPFR